MKLRIEALAVILICGCTERPPHDEGSEPAQAGSGVTFHGLATRLLWSSVETLGYEIYRSTGPQLFEVSIEYDERRRSVTFPRTCTFPVEITESTLSARGVACVFPEDSGRPNEEVRSQNVDDFRYNLSSTRFIFSTTGERRIVEGEYGPVHELLQGVLRDGEELLKYPPEAVGYEYTDAQMTTRQPTASDDSGCSDRQQFRSGQANGIVVMEASGRLTLAGWGCSSELQGASDEPAPCEYEAEPPAPIPRLWLTQLELSEAAFLMKGELRGADYKYCIELEAQNVTRL